MGERGVEGGTQRREGGREKRKRKKERERWGVSVLAPCFV